MKEFKEIWEKIENTYPDPIKCFEEYPILNLEPVEEGIYQTLLHRNNKPESILFQSEDIISVIYLNHQEGCDKLIQITSKNVDTDKILVWGDIIFLEEVENIVKKFDG